MLRIQSGKSLSELSTFGIGGPTRWYIDVKTFEEAEKALLYAAQHRIPYRILGKGSNCLFNDAGFNGLIIHNKIDFCEFSPLSVWVGAGYSFSRLGSQTAQKGWSGLEFAAGIPGTVGGAIYMNAGAHGREAAQSLTEVLYMDETGEQKTYSNLTFGYRKSPFQGMRGCILAARFSFIEDAHARISQRALLEARKKSQPLHDKSAGCIFRNPPKQSAGALIDQCGLKGCSIGGAKVSEIHANFIVNAAHATAADVLALIELVQQRVYAQTGIYLESEIERI